MTTKMNSANNKCSQTILWRAWTCLRSQVQDSAGKNARGYAGAAAFPSAICRKQG